MVRSDEDPHAVNFLIDEDGPDPVTGQVRADMPSIVWNGGMAVIALAAGPSFPDAGRYHPLFRHDRRGAAAWA